MNPDNIRLAYSLARQANGGNLPDLDMDHAQGINQNQDEVSKQQIEDTLNWDE